MDQPLFGEQSPRSRWAMIVFGGIMGLVLAFSIIVCLVFGFQTYKQNILFAILLVFLGALLFVIFRWYQTNDLDPKFRFYIAGMAIVVVWAAIVANTFAWMPPPPSSSCAEGNGLFMWQTKSCISLSGNGLAACQGFGMCLCFTQFPTAANNFQGNADCRNCTLCQGVPPPPNAAPRAAPKPPGTAELMYTDFNKQK